MNFIFLYVIWILFLAKSSNRAEGTFVSRDRVRFLREPVDQAVAIGSNVEIPCSVTCDDARCLFVTWTRNGSLIEFNAGVFKNSNGSLIVKDVREEHEGVYQCAVIAASYGVFLSQRANLNIARTGKLTEEPTDVIDAVSGGSVRFQCFSPAAVPPANITWYRDGILLDNDTSNSGRHMLPQGVLQISRLRDSDAGTYSCRSANIAGTIGSRNATLSISQNESLNSEEVLKIVHAPESLSVSRGQEAVFECLVQFAKKTTWKRIDEFPLSSKAYISGSNLVIPDISPSDDGTYGCIVEHSGRSVMLLANLTVTWAPMITKPPEETRRLRGESWRFNCYTSANPMPEITWYKNGERLRSHSKIKMFPNEQVQPTVLEKPNGDIEYVRDLLITSIEKDDAAVYQCFAENGLGSTTAAASLIYQETVELDGPSNLTAAVLPNQRELELTWNLPPLDLTNRSIIFIVHFHETETGSENTVAVKYDACDGDMCKSICCSNINLVPHTNYTFWVDALLDYNQTPPKFTRPSERIVVRTGDAAVSAAAPLLLQDIAEPGAVSLSWRKPSTETVKGDVTEYKIEIKTDGGPALNELVWWRQPTVVARSINQFTVRGIDLGSVLYFRVIARTMAGYPLVYPVSDFPWLRYYANRSRPNPENASNSILDGAPWVDAKSLNSSSIFVRWTSSPIVRSEKGEESVSGRWLISANRPLDGTLLMRAHVPYNESSVVLLGLEPNTLYQITVRSFAPGGFEGLRASVLAKTVTSESSSDGGPPPGGLARIVVPYPIPYCEPDGAGRLKIRWEKPPMSIVRVTLRYSLLPVDSNEPLNVSAYVKTVETSADHMIFNDLIPGRMYLFAARAETEYGYKSVYSHDVNCSVPLSRPRPPQNVEAVMVNGSLLVSWTPVTSTGGRDGILFYHVRYSPSLVDRRMWEEIIVPGANTSVIVHDLNSSIYFVTVSAESRVGRGHESLVKPSRVGSLAPGPAGASHWSNSSPTGGEAGSTVIFQTSYKEGVIIGVSIGLFCALVSAVTLYFRSRRDPEGCVHWLFFCHRRSGWKVSNGDLFVGVRRDSGVRCVELKEMQTLLPQLMENAESDSKGADGGHLRTHKVMDRSFNSLPSPFEKDEEQVRSNQRKWSQNISKPIAGTSARIPSISIETASNNHGSSGCAGALENARCKPMQDDNWRRKHRLLTSSLPNLLDIEKKLCLFGDHLNGPLLTKAASRRVEDVHSRRSAKNGGWKFWHSYNKQPISGDLLKSQCGRNDVSSRNGRPATLAQQCC